MKSEPLEKDIQRTICEWLTLKQLFFWRSNNIPVFGMNNGGQRTFRSLGKWTPRGIPDIILLIHGQFVGIEVKRPGRKLSPDQEIFKERCEKNGAVYLIVTSLEDLTNQLFI